jgi:hypothetical protein
MSCQPWKCRFQNSTLAIWGQEFAHHLSTGGSIKCDVCRNGLATLGHDGPCYICNVCNKGMCESCKNNHKTATCNPYALVHKQSSLATYRGDFEHHLSTGGTIKCDVCRVALCSLQFDTPCWVCPYCNLGMCAPCSKTHEK